MKIRELRVLNGLTQTELGKKLGLNQSAIGKYERNELEPNIETLKKLSDIFGCSIDYLVGREDDFGIVKSGAELQLKEDEAKLLGEYRLLDEINKIKVQTFIYALAH